MTALNSNRVDTLDATKGTLVVFMVIYHSLNYSSQYQLAFKYLSFVPPSFILITGFLLSSVYLARHHAGDLKMYARLLTRGAKLLGLFTLLNLTAQLLQTNHFRRPAGGMVNFFDHWPAIYLFGNTRFAAFEILVPIAYLLLMAPVLIIVAELHRRLLPVFGLVILGIGLALDLNGLSSSHLNLIGAGVLGMWIGQISFQGLDRLRPYLVASIAGYGVYVLASRVWGHPFLLQLAGALLALAVIYGATLHLTGETPLKHWLVRLGRYSLVSYIAQIAILQVLSRMGGRPDPRSLGLVAFILVTLLLTTLVVEAVEWTRMRLPVVNGAYRAVFA